MQEGKEGCATSHRLKRTALSTTSREARRGPIAPEPEVEMLMRPGAFIEGLARTEGLVELEALGITEGWGMSSCQRRGERGSRGGGREGRERETRTLEGGERVM